LGPLPSGDYLVTGVLDQNQDQRQGAREAYASSRLPRGKSDVGELWAFAHDTTAPRIQTITVDDSVSATVAFSQKLDPRQRLSPRDVRLRLLPDSVPVTVASILPKPVDDSLNRRTTPADTATAPDTLEGADTIGARRRPGPTLRDRAPPSEMMTSRPPLFDRLVLRVPRPWAPGSRLVLDVRGVRNVNGVSGNAVGVVAVPEKPKPAPTDTAKVKTGRDTTGARTPRRPPPAPPRQ
jgi:hypothetical protein